MPLLLALKSAFFFCLEFNNKKIEITRKHCNSTRFWIPPYATRLGVTRKYIFENIVLVKRLYEEYNKIAKCLQPQWLYK